MRVQKLSAAVAAIALSLVGLVAVATPAQAIGPTNTVSAVTSPLPTFTANTASAAFTVNLTSTSAMNLGLEVNVQDPGLTTRWVPISTCPTSQASATTTLATCGIASITANAGSFGSSVSVWKISNSFEFMFPNTSTVTDVTIAFSSAAWSSVRNANTYNFTVTNFAGGNSPTFPITVAAAPTTYTAMFNSNGGSGGLTPQVGSSTTALTLNNGAIHRTGYTFTGWNTAANGSGTSYADGAPYAFTSSTTLYAQWTADSSGSSDSASSSSTTGSGLASTGADASLPIGVAATLLLVGAALMLMRRKHAA